MTTLDAAAAAAAAARRAFAEGLVDVGDLLELFGAAFDAASAVLGGDVAGLAATFGVADHQAEDVGELLAPPSHLPPIGLLVDALPGPIGAENLSLSISGSWRAVDSFIVDGHVYVVFRSDAMAHAFEMPYRRACAPDSVEDVATWRARTASWVDADDDEDGL